jgi:serine protease Do
MHSVSIKTVRRHGSLVAVAAGLLVSVVFSSSAVSARGVGPQTVAPLAERLIDAVVNISTSQNVKGPQGVPLPYVPKGSPFEEFFEEFFSRRGSNQPQDRKQSSLGSGFVIDPSGLVVTNNHVIDGADEIVINFNDGSKLKVDKVLGKDPKTDLALLKVTPKKPLQHVSFGSSAKAKVGDWVMAIGNPFGLGGSVTVGIISAKQRDINTGPYDDFLQTDASINRGNSGGPLFSMDGEVIGVNTAIMSPTGGSIGIGFAVPADTAINVIDQLKRFGETRRGWIGVNIQSVTDEIAASLGLASAKGALVSNIAEGGPAAKAGVANGDVIVRFDGKDVSGARALPRIVAETPIDKKVAIEVLRKRERRSLEIVVGRLEDAEAKDKAKPVQPETKSTGKALLGMTLAPLTDELRKRHRIGAKVEGLVVTEVTPDGPSASKGVREGDVLVEAAQDAVRTVDDVVKAIEKVRKAGRTAILLRLEDGRGDMRFVAVPLN